MGMLDVLKRWFDGERKPQAKQSPARPASRRIIPGPPRPAAPVAPVSVAPAPARTVAAPLVADPSSPAVTVVTPMVRREPERRTKPRVNARVGTLVLIIDDSPTIVALLKRMLEQSGYTASEAGDAETGVALALTSDPDLIFLDIVLPGMNGFEALRRLRREPITKGTPIIMISGNELATEQFYAQRIGADDFMKKPFSRSEVFARIEKLLDEDKVPRRQATVAAATAGVAAAAPAQ
jgi:twitching motility two-component system response regulator PilH